MSTGLRDTEYLAAATLVALAGLYLGCTNPGTVVDPRTPAGNATSDSSTKTFSKLDATGQWLVEQADSNPPKGGTLSVRQSSDGAVVGYLHASDYSGLLNAGATNTSGTLKFEVPGTPAPFEGVISEDGKTMSLTLKYDTPTQFKCTRLF